MVLEESTEISEELICFLEGTELGTNGAKYTHLDVRKRIHQTDNPKSYSLKRNATIMANVTFCIRDFAYYVRYFAFHPVYQRTSGMKARNRPNSVLQQRIQHVFDTMNTEKALPFLVIDCRLLLYPLKVMNGSQGVKVYSGYVDF